MDEQSHLRTEAVYSMQIVRGALHGEDTMARIMGVFLLKIGIEA